MQNPRALFETASLDGWREGDRSEAEGTDAVLLHLTRVTRGLQKQIHWVLASYSSFPFVIFAHKVITGYDVNHW
jgi:hypothetical protein